MLSESSVPLMRKRHDRCLHTIRKRDVVCWDRRGERAEFSLEKKRNEQMGGWSRGVGERWSFETMYAAEQEFVRNRVSVCQIT